MYIWSSIELLQQQNSQDGAFISNLTEQEDALMGEQFWNFCRESYPAIQDNRSITCYNQGNQPEEHGELAIGTAETVISQQLPTNAEDIVNDVGNISEWTLQKRQEQQQLYRSIPLRERRLKCSDKLHLDITMATLDTNSKSIQSCINDMTNVSDVLSPLPLTPNYVRHQ